MMSFCDFTIKIRNIERKQMRKYQASKSTDIHPVSVRNTLSSNLVYVVIFYHMLLNYKYHICIPSL